MAVWMVRAGRYGEHEALALEQGLSVIGWSEMPDLSTVPAKEAMRELVQQVYPDASTSKVSNFVGQLWAFRERIAEGDLVVLPLKLKTRAAVAIGRITGPYQYRPDLPGRATHVRATHWIRTDIPRNAFLQDLLYSFGAFMTACQITRNNAEERVNAILAGSPDPGFAPQEPDEVQPPHQHDEDETAAQSFELETYAIDQILAYLSLTFRGHNLARLVNELLKAQGYQTQLSPPGPDGGVDILAAAGPMGFDAPRLCVQVKSGDSPVDVGVLRELKGVMASSGAQQGLLVSWAGFRNSVTSEARRLFFEVRLWDAGDLVAELLQHYDKLSDDIRAELPLKPIYILVPQDEGQ